MAPGPLIGRQGHREEVQKPYIHSLLGRRGEKPASGAIYVGERMIARFNGTFYLPDHDGMLQPGATGETALSGMKS